MTVVNVYGRVNRHDVIYTYIGNDEWECHPGDAENGIYVAEVWAEDDAGNISYRLAKLYIYDGRCIKIEWIPDEYELQYIASDFDLQYIPSGFNLQYVGSGVNLQYVASDFTLEYVRC